jgi:two-component system OmpR family response regulator
MEDALEHILIVDDDRQLLGLLASYLKSSGYHVSTARDGRAMRATLEANRVDLIVLDLMLPGEDGLSLCRELRVRGVRPIPILMLTARGEEADRIVGLEMGADDYLCKPLVSCSRESAQCCAAHTCCH